MHSSEMLLVLHRPSPISFFFFFNDTATTEIYTLSLHDALPISRDRRWNARLRVHGQGPFERVPHGGVHDRSEEHTSELQSPCNLVCRLLLEKKKNIKNHIPLADADSILDISSIPTTSPLTTARD